ncbi:uncharacterized protein [Rutidosis leptorrhynchoides]|uniref:uncharacterized protein n=1 Tax=Rutidosis leptorrhynchoides TaxID=125765 RepID=UPI003A98F0D0
MSNYHEVANGTSREDQNHNGDHETAISRDIHALTPSSILPQTLTTHHHNPLGSYLSMSSSDRTFRDDFSNMSLTNSTLVVAGSVIESMEAENGINGVLNRSVSVRNEREVVGSVSDVKKEEVESKITAWKNGKIAEITNRFKCEDAIIKGWESEQVQKATLKMKQVERKLEEKKARAMEKMENEIAKAHQKAEERRASAESIRGTKMSRVLEVANLMKAVGRSPVKNFF